MKEIHIRTIRQIEKAILTCKHAMLIRMIPGALFLIPLIPSIAFCQQAATVPVNGKKIYEQRCIKCHGKEGGGVTAVVSMMGPSLKAEHDRNTVLNGIRKGKGKMPTFANLLSPQQIQAVADFVTQELAVIPLKGGNLSEGGEMFRTYCAPCHRTAVRGGALAFTSMNAPALTGKSPAIIAGTISWGPGPMPSFPISVINNQQLAPIVKYVRFVQHPPNPGGSPLNYYGPVAEGFVGWVFVFFLVGVAVLIEKGGKG